MQVLSRIPRPRPRLHVVRDRPDKPPRPLRNRIIYGLLVATIALSFIWCGGIPLTLFALAIATVSLAEFYRLARANQLDPHDWIGQTAGVLLVLGGGFLSSAQENSLVLWLIIGTWTAFLLISRRRTFTMSDVSVTTLGYLYVIWGFSQILQLRKMDGPMVFMGQHVTAGLFYTWLLAWTIAFSDIGCFAFGRLLGKHKLCPWISPNKTVEGSIGGVVTACVVACLWCMTADVPTIYGVWIGLAGAVASQFGDLWESYLKRDAGVKDAGALIPGHGGLLDRFDSFFFATPVIYLVVRFLVGV
ncbi:MAG TPA: phosphatidate cytidylyltransferase [Candidatus Xenobia bacterium]